MGQFVHHNYRAKLEAMIRAGRLSLEPGAVYHIDVYHDDDCGVFEGGACDCEPEIVVRAAEQGWSGRE